METKNQIKIKSTEFKIIFEGKHYKARCSSSYIQGSTTISDDDIVVRWDSFNSEGLSILRDENNSLYDPKLYKAFRIQNSSEVLNLYVVIQKSDVIELNRFQLETLKDIKTYPNLKKITIDLAKSEKEKIDIANKILQSIPKTITLEINCDDDSGLLKNEQFWSELLNFNEVLFKRFLRCDFKIYREDQELDQTCILKSRVKALFDCSYGKVTLNKILKILFLRESQRSNYRSYFGYSSLNRNKKY